MRLLLNSELRNFIIRKKDSAQDIPVDVSASATLGVVDVIYTSGVGCLCCLFFLMGSEGPEFGISQCSNLRFFMDSYLGNEQLLDQTLVAFFASRETPDDVAQRALRWAVHWMFPLTYTYQKVRKSKIFHSRTALFREKHPLRSRNF